MRATIRYMALKRNLLFLGKDSVKYTQFYKQKTDVQVQWMKYIAQYPRQMD